VVTDGGLSLKSCHDNRLHLAEILSGSFARKTKMPNRLQEAEAELRERERVLSEDHGGTAQERQAIADAINGQKMLQRDVVEWQKRQSPGSLKTQPD